MRDNDIIELLDHVAIQILEIEKEISKSINEKSRLELFKPRIKSCLENLRSCLEYSAHDIFDKLKPKLSEYKTKNRKIYFPYGKNSGQANSSIHLNLPELNLHLPEVYKLIESIQYHKSNETWLMDLFSQTNNIKHNELTKQSKIESKNVKMFGGALDVTSTNITIKGNIFNGVPQSKDIVIVNNELKSDIRGNEFDIIIKDNIDFYFKGTNINILKLLKQSEKEIREFVKELYPLLSIK